jgi:gas vesicle protein
MGSFVIGVIVGAIMGIVALSLLQANKPTKNLCPRCSNETEEERQLKKIWEEQQKGYNN